MATVQWSGSQPLAVVCGLMTKNLAIEANPDTVISLLTATPTLDSTDEISYT